MSATTTTPKPLTCAHCKQLIGFLATYICFSDGERHATTYHLSCHQHHLRDLAANEAAPQP